LRGGKGQGVGGGSVVGCPRALFLDFRLNQWMPAQGSDASPTRVYSIPSILQRLSFEDIFGNSRPVELELGSGDGTFIADWAAANPARNFVAVERLLGRLRKIDRKAKRGSIDNLRILRIEASYLMEYLLLEASVSAMHVYFPDPWPKRRHWRRRLITARFAEQTQRALTAGGVIYLRTDDRDYFAQMRTVFGAQRSFAEIETPTELASVLTDFERGFLERGIETKRAAYRSIKN
jgi:tRNA (guanine-N7-)-methyltransferase